LTALGHLNTVKGVAMAPEEARYEVPASAELATLGIKLLPPILMIALVGWNTLGRSTSPFCRLLAHTVCKVVKSVSKAITLESSEQITLLTDGPSPLVHGASPVGQVLVRADRLFAYLAVEPASVSILVLGVLESHAYTLAGNAVTHTIVAIAVGLTFLVVAVLAAFTFNAASTAGASITGTETSQSVACTLTRALVLLGTHSSTTR
jgi:hypothetical protein